MITRKNNKEQKLQREYLEEMNINEQKKKKTLTPAKGVRKQNNKNNKKKNTI